MAGPKLPPHTGCLLIFLSMGFGAKFYGMDALPGANQQKHLYLFCIHYDSFEVWTHHECASLICPVDSLVQCLIRLVSRMLYQSFALNYREKTAVEHFQLMQL